MQKHRRQKTKAVENVAREQAQLQEHRRQLTQDENEPTASKGNS